MSSVRRCEIIKATNSKWYLVLGNFEHAYDPRDCSVYGPFDTEKQVKVELYSHSNPGGGWCDISGTIKPEDIQ